MKKIMLTVLSAVSVLVITGCCSTKSECAKAEACKTKACKTKAKCTKPCAKAKKCPFIGNWEMFLLKDGKLEALPVAPQPRIELREKGEMIFHYAKNDKPAVITGKWKVADGKLIIGDIKQTRVLAYTLQKDGTAVYTVGKGSSRLPENTKIVIRKVK